MNLAAWETLSTLRMIVPQAERPRRLSASAFIALAFWAAAAACVAAVPVDEDADGVADVIDNCLFAANPDQVDSDGDGIGNVCDADLNNDCVVNAIDLGLLKSVFNTDDAKADFNGDGLVDLQDLDLMNTLYFRRPGPTGQQTPCSCLPPKPLDSRTRNSAFSGDQMFLLSELPAGDEPLVGINSFSDQGKGIYIARIFAAQAGVFQYAVADQAASSRYCGDAALPLYTPTDLTFAGCAGPAGTVQIPAAGCYQFTMRTDQAEFPDAIELTMQQRLAAWDIPVDASGGSFTMPNGVALEIPPSAVTEPVTLTIGELPCAQFDALFEATALDSHDNRCIGGITAEPDGFTFGAPVAITLPVDALLPGEIPLFFSNEPGRHDYTIVPAEVTYHAAAGMIETTLTGFSDKAVGGATRRVLTSPDPDTLPECFRQENPPPGNCCSTFKSVSAAGDATSTGCDCELLGSEIRTEFPLCPGSPLFYDSITHSSENCPEDLQAFITPAAMSMWACEGRDVKVELVGTNDDGASCNLPLPVTWSVANEAVASVQETGPTTARVTGRDGGSTRIRAESLVGANFSLEAPVDVVAIDGSWTVEESGSQTCVESGDPTKWVEADTVTGTTRIETLGCALLKFEIGYPGASDSSGTLTVTGKPERPIDFEVETDNPNTALSCVLLRDSNGAETDFGEAPCWEGDGCVILSCSDAITATGSLGPASMRRGTATSSWDFSMSWAQSGETYSISCNGKSDLVFSKD